MHDRSDPIAATWLANHRKAPGRHRPRRCSTPARRPRCPRATPSTRTADRRWTRSRCARCGSRRATASRIFEGSDLLAVIPGWSDMSKGMPGYSRDVIGQTPFGWSLDDAMEGLGPRVSEASDFWRWRLDPQAWAQFQQGMLGHLLDRLGPGARYWDVSGNRRPLVGRLRAAADRAPVLHGAEHGRDELPADAGGSSRPARTRPARPGSNWRSRPRCRATRRRGSSCGWRSTHGATSAGSGTARRSAGTTSRRRSRSAHGNEAILFLDNPGLLLGPEVPDTTGFTVGGRAGHVAVADPDHQPRAAARARAAASSSLVNQMASQSRSWVVS